MRSFASADELTAAAIGKWVYCDGAPDDFNGAPFELASDGTWYQLSLTSTGDWVRLQSFGQSGSFTITGSSPYFNITFTYNNTPSTLTSNIAMSDSLEQLLVEPGRHVRVQ